MDFFEQLDRSDLPSVDYPFVQRATRLSDRLLGSYVPLFRKRMAPMKPIAMVNGMPAYDITQPPFYSEAGARVLRTGFDYVVLKRKARPIAMVFSDGYFNSMAADDYRSVGLPVPDLSDLPGGSPVWVSVSLPEDPAEQLAIRRTLMQSQIPLRAAAELYVPFATEQIDVSRDGLLLADLKVRDEKTPFLGDFLNAHSGALEDYLFLPFGTRYTLALLAFRIADQELIFVAIPGGILEQQPQQGS